MIYEIYLRIANASPDLEKGFDNFAKKLSGTKINKQVVKKKKCKISKLISGRIIYKKKSCVEQKAAQTNEAAICIVCKK